MFGVLEGMFENEETTLVDNYDNYDIVKQIKILFEKINEIFRIINRNEYQLNNRINKLEIRLQKLEKIIPKCVIYE